MKKGAKIAAVFFMTLFLGVNSLWGQTITINLTAEITYIYDPSVLLDGQVSVGDIITGSYTYDSDTPDTDVLNLPTVGQYQHSSPPYGISLSGDGFIFQTDPDNVDFLMGILNNHNGRDSYAFGSYNNLPLSNGVEVDHISLQLDDYSCTALSSDELPTTPPVLEDWPDSSFGLTITYGYKGSSMIRSTVTSVELVPEPATILLIALGGLALLRRR